MKRTRHSPEQIIAQLREADALRRLRGRGEVARAYATRLHAATAPSHIETCMPGSQLNVSPVVSAQRKPRNQRERCSHLRGRVLRAFESGRWWISRSSAADILWAVSDTYRNSTLSP